MGNYYEGDMQFGLKKDVPKHILKDLILLSLNLSDEEDFLNENFSKEFKETKWFQHERYSYPHYTLWVGVKSEDDWGYEEVTKEILNQDNFLDYPEERIVNYVFEISFCMKKYQSLGEYIFEYLFPYVDASMYDMEDGGFIGKIKDEDGTYCKRFFIDESIHNKKVESRQYICKGCKLGFPNELCVHWDRCVRAYQIGQKKRDS